MIKLSGADMAQILRKLASNYRQIAEENETFKKSLRVDKLIDKMASKGLNPFATDDELRADLIKKADEGKLDVVEAAVDYSGGMSSIKLASVDSSDSKSSDISGAELTSYILTGSE